MPGLAEPAQVGKRQDLSNYITNIERENFPFLSALPKDKDPVSTNVETQMDDYGSTDDMSGVGTGEDVSSFTNQAENRAINTTKVMKMRETAMVDDFAENVSENPALAKGEYLEQVKKASVRLKMRIEKFALTRLEARTQQGATQYRTCAVGGWLKTGAPVGEQISPARFRPTAAQVYTGTLADLREEHIHDQLQESFENTHGTGSFMGFLGSELKQTISLWSIFRPDQAGSSVVRQFDGSADTLKTMVDILVGDFGRVQLVPSTRVRYFEDDGSAVPVATTTAQRRGSGVILDMTRWAIAFKRRPNHRRLEDRGGGPRGLIDAIFALRSKSPRANSAIWVSA
jgi:hypothetical protein